MHAVVPVGIKANIVSAGICSSLKSKQTGIDLLTYLTYKTNFMQV